MGENKAELIRADGEVEHTFTAGDILSIHGQTGEVFSGSRALLEVEKTAEAIKQTTS